MFGNKKIKGPIQLSLATNKFCAAWNEQSKNCTQDLCVIADADHYHLLYRNGEFLGTPAPYGGKIYPFSKDPRQRGSRGDMKDFLTAKVVCISKKFNLKVLWGTKSKFTIIDKATGQPYHIGASGSFMVEIEPSDGGTNANLFYGSLLSQGDPSKMDTEALRESLVDLFINRVGDRIQACIKELDRPLSEIGGLQPSEFLQISNQVYPSIKNVFADYGLTITEKSRDSVVLRFMIESV